jgi:hypothetical protein
MVMISLLRVNKAVPDVIRKVSLWEGCKWNAGIIIELSAGLRPGRHGGSVNPIDVFGLVRLGSLLKETLDRPPSMENVERCDIFVRIFGGDLKIDDIVCVKYVREGR